MATNKVYNNGSPLRIAVASTIVSGDPVVLGELGGGVALTDYDSGDGKATVDFEGVFDLSVKGTNGSDVAVSVGDAIYYNSGATPKLNKDTAGIFFGHALEAVVSGATTTINVRLAGSGSHSAAMGVFVSAETTGTGFSQNVAHGLGATPSKVLVSLTEFASNLSVDVAEGSHTSTNVVLTVTSGAKFKVLAIR